MELKICQSCGMPMQEEQYGTEKDGSKNDTYCCYCYKNGEMEECTMEAKTLEEAKEMLMAYFPTLSRWKKEA